MTHKQGGTTGEDKQDFHIIIIGFKEAKNLQKYNVITLK